ncbi:hypothetical protein V2J09_017453 [Rumex salicifolius]
MRLPSRLNNGSFNFRSYKHINGLARPPAYLFPVICFLALLSLVAVVVFKVEDFAYQTKTVAGHNLDPTPWHIFQPKVFENEQTSYSRASKILQCNYFTCPLRNNQPKVALFDPSRTSTCPEFFRWIHKDLEPWSQSKISLSHSRTMQPTGPETNVGPWDDEFKDIKKGSQSKKWIMRQPFAYWKGNPYVASPMRMELLKCNDTKQWRAQIFNQNHDDQILKRWLKLKDIALKGVVDLAIEDVEQKQLHAIMLDKYRGSSLRTFSPLEEQAFDTLTPYAFRKFQEEFGRATQYLVSKYDINEYIVQYYKEGDTQKHKVSWNG